MTANRRRLFFYTNALGARATLPAEPLLQGGSTPPTFDLEITKSITLTTGQPGTAITYTITISNNGPQVANDLLITGTLPPEIIISSICHQLYYLHARHSLPAHDIKHQQSKHGRKPKFWAEIGCKFERK